MPDPIEPGVYLEIHKATAYHGHPLQACIVLVNPGGGGHGYRIHGPKYGGAQSVLQLRVKIEGELARSIQSYLDLVPTIEAAST